LMYSGDEPTFWPYIKKQPVRMIDNKKIFLFIYQVSGYYKYFFLSPAFFRLLSSLSVSSIVIEFHPILSSMKFTNE